MVENEPCTVEKEPVYLEFRPMALPLTILECHLKYYSFISEGSFGECHFTVSLPPFHSQLSLPSIFLELSALPLNQVGELRHSRPWGKGRVCLDYNPGLPSAHSAFSFALKALSLKDD